MRKCGACNNYLSSSEYMTCCKCNNLYHHACVGFRTMSEIPRVWCCALCSYYLPPDKTDTTPSKGIDDQPSAENEQASAEPNVEEASQTSVTDHKVEPDGVQSEHREIRLFREEIKTVRHEILDIRQDILQIKDKVLELDRRVEDMETKIPDEAMSAEILSLVRNMSMFQLDMQERDQELLINDVQILGVAEEPGENTVQLVMKIGAKLGVELKSRDMVFAKRMGARYEDEDEGEAEAEDPGRNPRFIVVRLTRRILRDQLLRAVRVQRFVTTEGLGLKSYPNRIFINERLTKLNGQIFQLARERARQHGWQFVWTYEGKVQIREAEGLPWYHMRRLSDLDIFMPSSFNS